MTGPDDVKTPPVPAEPPIAEPQADDSYYRENARYNSVRSSPVPWYIIALWLGFLGWGFWYLLKHLR